MPEKRYLAEDADRSMELPRPAGVPGRAPVTAKLFPGALLRKARDERGVAPGAEDAVARAASSGGAPLPGDVRARFEGSLGADLSGVRVHTGGESADAAGAVGARAYAVGNDIHFAAGQYAPTDPFGLHLLAHEVAHTQQQASGSPHRQHKLEVSAPGDAAEVEADRAADAMVAGASASVAGGLRASVSRVADPAPVGGGQVAAAPSSMVASPSVAAAASASASADAVAHEALAARASNLAALHEAQRSTADAGLSAKIEPLRPSSPAPAAPAPLAPKLDAKVPSPPPVAAARAQPTGPVQRLATEGDASPDRVHAAAGAAVATPGQTLPYGDVVQTSFGRHELSDVVAHVGGPAAAFTAQMGASAFATGNHLVFGSAPDLHTVAHEAAHVVQQRAGASPKDGIGERGDAYERHADEVADAVVRGDSAEELLGPAATGSRRAPIQFSFNTSAPAKPQFAGLPQGDGHGGVSVAENDVPSDALPPGHFVRLGAAPHRFFSQAIGIDTTPLSEANDLRMILDTNVATKSAAIDAALAADHASGAKLDDGLASVIIDYQQHAATASGMADDLRGRRDQTVAIGDRIAAIKSKAAAEKAKDDAKEQSSDEKARATEAIHAAHAKAEELQKASIDLIGALGKVAVDPSPGAVIGSAVDIMGITAKTVVHFWNDEDEKAQSEAAIAKLNAKWGPILASIDADNAAAIQQECESAQHEIDGIKASMEGVKKEMVAAMQAARKDMVRILHAKSPVTALAKIQDFLKTVGPHADKLSSQLVKIQPMFAWDYRGDGAELRSWIAASRGAAMQAGGAAAAEQRSSDDTSSYGDGPTAPSDKSWQPKLQAFLQQLQRLEGWAEQATSWLAFNEGEIRRQLSYANGGCSQKAQAALQEISMMTGS